MTSSYRIIIAHDAPLVQSFLTRLIQLCYPSARIAVCEHGVAALQMYEEHGGDLLLTDYHMPRMDGPTLIRTLRDRQVSLPIIGLSGEPINEHELRQAGADAFLCAPFSVSVFEHVIHALLPPLAARVRGAHDTQ
jgi:two-component system, chemotaxis family, chemotaxis protein CheY